MEETEEQWSFDVCFQDCAALPSVGQTIPLWGKESSVFLKVKKKVKSFLI